MIKDNKASGTLGRLWQLVLNASETAVAVQYAAPWTRADQGHDIRQ